MTGGNLCLPQLGIKVPYAPGARTVLRGDKMDRLVADYTGPRYFVIGTHHESVKRYIMRKVGTGLDPNTISLARIDENEAFNEIAPPPSPPQDGTPNEAVDSDDDDSVGFPLNAPCVNDGRDSDDEEDPPWTNWELHEDRALDSSESESYS